ncbi:hypothetical protein LDENG_00136220 [Lucifuga dentata]|nr:hypothetical protein LDENG_00136220 [Lucifuga dentata]
MDQHKGHVSAEAERMERQREVEVDQDSHTHRLGKHAGQSLAGTQTQKHNGVGSGRSRGTPNTLRPVP